MKGPSLIERVAGESGAAPLIVFLVLLLLLIAVMSGSVDVVQSVTVSDIQIQEAVASAVKAAAMCVEPRSQAEGRLRINSAAAHAAFRNALADNMGLDRSTLAPKPGSYCAKTPSYWLVIYNGSDDYAAYGAEGAKLYVFDGASAAESALPYPGFPVSFVVSDNGIAEGAGGVYTVELKSPGAVALVAVEAKQIIGGGTLKIKRWAAARIVCKGGACAAQ